jgi:hypothetical protein
LRAAVAELEPLLAVVVHELHLPPLKEVVVRVRDWQAMIEGFNVPAQRRILVELIKSISPAKLGFAQFSGMVH